MHRATPLASVVLLVAAAFPAGVPGNRLMAAAAHDPPEPASAEPADERVRNERVRNERREFQSQELMLARSGSWIFPPGQTPRILWRDPETVRRLGCREPLRVRWFDGGLRESPAPDAPGRWLAWVEGTAPNGMPLRRSLTFYRLPEQLPSSFVPDLTVAFPNFPGPRAPVALREHQSEILRVANELVVPAVLDSEQGAILVAGLAEAPPLGRPATFLESTAVMNDDCHLALKLKVQGLRQKVRPLQPPRRREPPATELRPGSPADAGVRPDAKARIDAVCRAWAEDTGEPFVTLVARRGVIVTHEAFGRDAHGRPIDREYRRGVASITKTVTGILFSRFLDQGLADLDDSLATVFADYPRGDSRVPTFRQCFTHTSGLTGHGEWGGMRNASFENVVLNGIDVNEPGAKYVYSGQGFELAVKAMEILAGQSAVRLYHEHLFRPLGLGDVPIRNAGAGGEFTARELAILAQWVANRGSYGSLEFIRPETFGRLMPEALRAADRGYTEDEGIGIHWMRHLKPGAPRGSKRPEDLLFGPRTLGHGSLSGCVFLVDPDAELVVTQVRQQSGPRSGDWSERFFQAIAAALGSE